MTLSESVIEPRIAYVTDESIDRAARFLYRKDAPMGEPHDAWDKTVAEPRKDIYRRSAQMIAELHNGWNS